ncbi:hypothetical protein NKJ46_25220 [Mesorhizobium sp. M0166]|uniref:hypothetical protein n=1 Tax=Mesorhizobium sp. M0166 TaxID=2956902 RepID=UPI00333BDF49
MSRPATAAVRLLTGEREPVRLATTADILLHGLQAIDGVPAEVGDRVVVKDQADPTQNGIYTASAGEWFRAADARTTRTLQKGTTVHTQIGAVNADRVFEFTADEPAVGTDAITIAASVPPDIAALRLHAMLRSTARAFSRRLPRQSASASPATVRSPQARVAPTALSTWRLPAAPVRARPAASWWRAGR